MNNQKRIVTAVNTSVLKYSLLSGRSDALREERRGSSLSTPHQTAPSWFFFIFFLSTSSLHTQKKH